MNLKINRLLNKLKIKYGDNLIIHSSFKPLSKHGVDANLFLKEILSKIGKHGTLIMPTLSWKKVKKNKKFNYLKTLPDTGILPKILLKKFPYNRSFHPTHSVVVLGKKKNYLLKDIKKKNKITPCNPSGIWGKILKLNPKIILINVLLEKCTIIHLFEEMYLGDFFLKKNFKKYNCIDQDGNKKTFYLKDHQSYKIKKYKRNFNKYFDFLKKNKLVNKLTIKNDVFVYQIKARDLEAAFINKLTS